MLRCKHIVGSKLVWYATETKLFATTRAEAFKRCVSATESLESVFGGGGTLVTVSLLQPYENARAIAKARCILLEQLDIDGLSNYLEIQCLRCRP